MPGFDKTGPDGAGPRTGRGMGHCAGCNNGCPCVGHGRDFGFRRHWLSPKNNLRDLKDEEVQLERQLEAVKNEIEAVEKQVQQD